MSLVAPTIDAVVSECSKYVYVTGQKAGSTVTIFQDGAPIGDEVATSASMWVDITPGTVLTQGKLITATQSLGSEISLPSGDPMEVQGIPDKPPAPIFKTHLYGCATCLYLGGMVPGADYRVRGQNAVTLMEESRGSGSTSYSGAPVVLNQALWTGEKLRASYDSCGKQSGTATSQPAEQYAVDQLPPPTINEPLFKCDTNVYGKDCVPGATVTMRRKKSGKVVQQDDQCSGGQVNFTANPILDTGEKVVIWQKFKGNDRCAKKSINSDEVSVRDPALIEPPQVLSPLCAGGVIITLTNLRTAAKVTIFHDGKQYEGEAAGVGPQNFDVGPLTGGKDVHAVMEHCGVTTGDSNYVMVNRVAAPIGAPKVQDPLFSCTDIVHVSNIQPGSWVKVYSSSIGLIGKKQVYVDEADITVVPALMEGDPPTKEEIYAEQFGCGSGKSNVVEVKKPPSKLNSPTVVTPLYDGRSHVWVKDVLPGALVEVYVRRKDKPISAFAGQERFGTSEGSVGLDTPLHTDDKVKARQSLCDKISGFSSEVTVKAPQFVYVANYFSDNVSGYTINPSTGALTPIAGSPFAAGTQPHSVAVDPSGKFAYVVSSGSSDNVWGYTINPTTGKLTIIAGSPFAAGTSPYSVAVDPSGKFAYVANSESNNVSGYTINPSTGALTPIAGSPFAAGHPSSVAVDPSGKFAYVTNEIVSPGPPAADDTVSGYTINPTTGKLTPIAGSPFAAGAYPSSVAVDPSGKFAYVANSESNNVSGYTINPSTGALTTIAGSPFAAGRGPSSVAVDPSGKFAYVANSKSHNVSGYTINPTTGKLTTIAGSPFAAGTSTYPASVAVDPSGKFAYVANSESNNVSGYTINPSTGALTPIAGSPFAAGTFPLSVAVY